MLITARAEYACLAMLELASRYQEKKPIRAQDITSKHDIPPQFLAQIFIQMKAAGLIQTVRGNSGGYQLARAPETISIADIVECFHSRESYETPRRTDSYLAMGLQKLWQQFADNKRKFLEAHTLADLLPSHQSNDYVI